MKSTILLFAILWVSSTNASMFAQPTKIIIDADTGNELDDIVAIARALKSSEVEVIGLTAAQWKHQQSNTINSVEASLELNNTILKLMGRESIPSLLGSEMLVGERWEGLKALKGEVQPRQSAASDFLITKVKELQGEEKLVILTLGALTNVASAILLEPPIAEKISLYFIGTWYDVESGVWNKNEFNVQNDLNAFDVILNTKGLELHIMPANVSRALSFKNKSSISRLEGKSGISGLVHQRWQEVVPNPNDEWGWIMWDLALIHAFINSHWVEKKIVKTPSENLAREITVFTKIDHEKMRADFWEQFE